MNATYLRMEIRRLIRNRRLLLLSMLLPALVLLIFGSSAKHDTLDGVTGAEYIMASMAVYAAMVAATGSGGTIAVERGLGWNRQLRLTPLTPGRYVLSKVILSLLMAIPPTLVTFLVGALVLGVRLPAGQWLGIGVGAWLSTLPFAALGVALGYLARPDSAQQIGGLVITVLAAIGGLWIPITQMPATMRSIAKFTPTYWAGEIARGPLFHHAVAGRAVGVLVAWAVGLALVAAVRFRADTARA
ncbi:MAG TPA: ABC transporter permease [Micromonosporaceae bacterium]